MRGSRRQVREVLAPVVRNRDNDWLVMVKWTLLAMMNAEELGISPQNVDEAVAACLQLKPTATCTGYALHRRRP